MTPRRRLARSALVVALASAVAGGTLLAPAGPTATADTADTADADEPAFVPGTDPVALDDLGGPPSRESLDRAVTRFDPGVATSFELEGAVRAFSYVEVVEDEVVVTLETDVLFDVDSAELSEAAVDRVREVARDLPAGVTASVAGHTDSVGDEATNQDLSQRRAQAVADAAAAERSDVTFDAQGFGETRLRVPESGDDVAEDRAQNRRVELRYSGSAPGASTLEMEEQDVEPVRAAYVPGDEPRVEVVDDVEPVAEQVVTVPGAESADERVRVGVEPIVVRGSVMRLRVQLTPLGPVRGATERISVYDLTGRGELHPEVVDPYALVSYEPVGSRGAGLEANPVFADTAVGRTVRYEVYLPRPVDDSLESLYVSVVPTWPTFEDVPVRWE